MSVDLDRARAIADSLMDTTMPLTPTLRRDAADVITRLVETRGIAALVELIQATAGEPTDGDDYFSVMLEQITRRVTEPALRVRIGLALIRAARKP